MTRLLPLALLLATTAAFAQPAAECPRIGEQLADHLASAKRRIGADGEVRVHFDVSAEGRAELREVGGTRRYRTPVRIALDSLDCRGGRPQRYVLNIRFVDPLPVAVASAASATLARADAGDAPAPR